MVIISHLVLRLYDQIVVHPIPSAAIGSGVAICLSWLMTRPRVT